MMWEEFEKIAGYEVSYEDYHNIIEPMYMAVPETVSKQEFVKMLDKKRFAKVPVATQKKKLVKEMKKVAERLRDTCEHYTDWQAKDRLEELEKQYKALVPGANYTYEHTRWTMEHLGHCRGCTYVDYVEFMDTQGHSFEKVELF